MNRILDTQTRFQIIENVIDAISDLHSLELIHRDLKWENVLYFENKEEITVKLADFGLSATCLMVDGKVGTFHTMAPEVRNCRSQYNGKPTDIFSLSIMISDLLECEFPIIPKMEHIDPMTRPNISQVKDMFLNYTILYGKMSSKAKEDVSELKNTLSLKEKLFIIESVLSQTNDLHMSGYVYGRLKWENVLYFKDNNRITVELVNFGFFEIGRNNRKSFHKPLTLDEKFEAFHVWRHDRENIRRIDVLALCRMIDELLIRKYSFCALLRISPINMRHIKYLFEKYRSRVERTEGLS